MLDQYNSGQRHLHFATALALLFKQCRQAENKIKQQFGLKKSKCLSQR